MSKGGKRETSRRTRRRKARSCSAEILLRMELIQQQLFYGFNSPVQKYTYNNEFYEICTVSIYMAIKLATYEERDGVLDVGCLQRKATK